MSLFGAAKKTGTFQKAKERLDKMMAESSGTEQTGSSSGVGQQLEIMGRGQQSDYEGTATTSEIAKEGRSDDEVQGDLQPPVITLPRDVFNQAVHIHNQQAWEAGRLSQMVSPAYSVNASEGGTKYEKAQVFMISDDSSSALSSPPPTTDYGGSEISFPAETPREETQYEGSLLALPLSAIPQDPFMTPRASGRSILAARYIQSEENTSMHAAEEEEEEEGVAETLRGSTPIPRKFEISDSSEDEGMTEVEWRVDEPYMTPTKQGKKCNKGKGVKRPETSERPIPNMPQIPSRRKLKVDWAKPAATLTNEGELTNLEAFIGEYLRNTNGLRDFMVEQEKYDAEYVKWYGEQAEHVAARQNHTDAAVMSVRKISMEIKEEVTLALEYDAVRADKLDDTLSKIEKRLAKIAPVNMAKTIENAMRDCMEQIVEKVTDQVVGRLEKLAEKERKEEIQRGEQVEATPKDVMSNIEFQLGATSSEEENRKVEKAIRAEMEVDRQELEQSKYTPAIPPGGVKGEFPRLEVGQVTILKKKPVVPALPQQKKKVVKKPEVKEIPKGPKADEKKKKPEVKKPTSGEKSEEKKKERWAQRAAAPPPAKKQPEPRQQHQGERKKTGDGFQEVR